MDDVSPLFRQSLMMKVPEVKVDSPHGVHLSCRLKWLRPWTLLQISHGNALNMICPYSNSYIYRFTLYMLLVQSAIMCRFGIMIRVYSKARIPSPSEHRFVMEAKYFAFRFGDCTSQYIPIILWSSVIGSLGYIDYQSYQMSCLKRLLNQKGQIVTLGPGDSGSEYLLK